ncbi:MAG: TrmH family RNA methyltransferase, partial [Acidobacteria bacterium]|nr:TrmH family RNA methyltransferase [Acidobacteriota bacterium]
FGSEGEGISRALLRKSHHVVTLPMRGHVNSLNLSTSVAATLYNFF